jgi:hypothetical protein
MPLGLAQSAQASVVGEIDVYVKYLDNGVLTPAAGAKVLLYHNGYVEETMYTFSNGFTAFEPAAGSNYWIQVRCEDDVNVRVRNANWVGDTTYYWESSHFNWNPATGKTVNFVFSGGSENYWIAYTAVRAEANWVYSNTSPHYRANIVVPIVCPFGTGNHFYTDSIIYGDYIQIQYQTTLASKSIISHEYAHALMYLASGTLPAGDTSGYHDSTTEFPAPDGKGAALKEGWADFMEQIMTNDYVNSIEVGGIVNQGEFRVWADYPGGTEKGDWDGWEVEGAFMSVLWDLYDGTSSTDYPYFSTPARSDSVSTTFNNIWISTMNDHPGTTRAFYDCIVSHIGNPNNSVYNVFYNARMDINNMYDID